MAWRYRIVARVDRPIFLQRKRDTMVGCLSNLPLVLIDEVYSLSINKTYIKHVSFDKNYAHMPPKNSCIESQNLFLGTRARDHRITKKVNSKTK